MGRLALTAGKAHDNRLAGSLLASLNVDLDDLFREVVDAVAGAKDQPLVKPSEAAARVVAMEALYKGARQKKWVNV